jgi:hypothetical protein
VTTSFVHANEYVVAEADLSTLDIGCPYIDDQQLESGLGQIHANDGQIRNN